MSAYGVIILMSLNNWFCPLEEFPQITGCQEHGQDNRNYARCCFWRAWLSFSSGCGRNEQIPTSVCHNFYVVHFKSHISVFYLAEKAITGVFMQKAHKLEIFVFTLTFACQGRNSFPCSEGERVWHFVNVLKSNWSPYFTQAKGNNKEMLKWFLK